LWKVKVLGCEGEAGWASIKALSAPQQRPAGGRLLWRRLRATRKFAAFLEKWNAAKK